MDSMFQFIGRDMAVDLGTANTLVYVRGRGHRSERAVGGRDQHEVGRDPRRRLRGQADDRPHAGPHRRDPSPQGRRHRGLRRDREDASLLHPEGAPSFVPRQAARRRVRSVGHHRCRAARRRRGNDLCRRAQRVHHRGADGRGDRCGASRSRADRQHGRRHRWRYDRGCGRVARRHRHESVDPHRWRRARRSDHHLHQEGILIDVR